MSRSPSATIKLRIFVACCVAIFGFVFLIGRLFYLQVIESEEYQRQAAETQLEVTEIAANRGAIYDSNGNKLAMSTTAWTICVYPYDNDAIVEKALLCGEQTTLYYDDLRGANNFVVYAEGQEHLRIHRGWLVAGKEAYYYVDRLENELSSDEQIYNLPKVTAWKVTDTDLCARFDEALDRYYDDGLGMLENPEVTDRVSVVFLIILFGFLPFAVLVTFTVFAIVTKKRVYRIQYIIVDSCALLVLVTVLVTFLIV